MAMADARHVQLARELVEHDDRIAAALAELRGLQVDVEELRARAQALAAFRAAYPGEQARLREAVTKARTDLRVREREVTAAAEELARAKEGEPQAEARRMLTRASDAAGSAQKKLTRLEDERETLEADAARLEDDIPPLTRRATDLAARLETAPRTSAPEQPSPGLEAVVDWSSRTRAALFVAVASLETERDQVVREASELVAAAVGDQSAITSVRVAAARIEAAAPATTTPVRPDGTIRASPS
jgi:chromosome segregation ATPase